MGYQTQDKTKVASNKIPNTTNGRRQSPKLARTLKDSVTKTSAPYNYPRQVVFVEQLPRTETGKVQRFKLRQMEQEAPERAAVG